MVMVNRALEGEVIGIHRGKGMHSVFFLITSSTMLDWSLDSSSHRPRVGREFARPFHVTDVNRSSVSVDFSRIDRGERDVAIERSRPRDAAFVR
jgi:hypothetical protein